MQDKKKYADKTGVTTDKMWKIKQIFDGEYGCEEPEENGETKVSVMLENEAGERKYITVNDSWLVKMGFDEGSSWYISKSEEEIQENA